MNSSDFDTRNARFVLDGCTPLYARRFASDGHGNPDPKGDLIVVESRWLPTENERQALINGAAIVLKVAGTNPQPVMMQVILDGKIVE